MRVSRKLTQVKSKDSTQNDLSQQSTGYINQASILPTVSTSSTTEYKIIRQQTSSAVGDSDTTAIDNTHTTTIGSLNPAKTRSPFRIPAAPSSFKSSTVEPTPEDMTLGGADRSSLSLPTKPRHSQINTAALAAAANCLEGASAAQRNESMMELIMTMLSPDTQRAITEQSSIQTRPAPKNLLQSSQVNEIIETPTPTKIIYPKSVTQEQETFAEGFSQALRQVQIRNQFIPTPSLQSPSLVNILLNALTPVLPQQRFPGTSNLSSPIDGAQVVVTRPDGGETVVQLSPTAPNSSSTTTTLSPLSDSNSLLTSTIQQGLASTLSQSTTFTSATAANSLTEFVKKLDSQTAQGYMDIFNQHSLTGDLSAPNPFPAFINPPSSSSTSTSMLPPSVPQQQNHTRNGLQVKPEPTQQSSSPHSAAMLATLGAAIQNGYGAPSSGGGPLIHSSQAQNSIANHNTGLVHSQTSSTGGRYTTTQSLDMDDQERKKLERKRARNRAAASKCRQRKLERIQELEGLVQVERQRNAQLQTAIDRAQQDLQELRQRIEEHQQAGCSIGN